ncbi:hypothetical protein CQA66_07305 [Helicobacter aurati]|uniref:Uncharacterized protein n=1 Tax=Helicobacter aurati TaxID=137778 RepID=A0A3D8J0W7_9HELI|nr:hypothetical protein [Helicobacter aurati]RDU71013.1 hypothetical protein CQA66_07305 [Helicobacter aurati]
MNTKLENRKVLAILDFFYGFFFGCAIFAASLAFIIIPYFFSAILLAVSLFAIFIFLMLMIKYFRMRMELAQMTFDVQVRIYESQQQILHALGVDKEKHLDIDNAKDSSSH